MLCAASFENPRDWQKHSIQALDSYTYSASCCPGRSTPRWVDDTLETIDTRRSVLPLSAFMRPAERLIFSSDPYFVQKALGL